MNKTILILSLCFLSLSIHAQKKGSKTSPTKASVSPAQKANQMIEYVNNMGAFMNYQSSIISELATMHSAYAKSINTENEVSYPDNLKKFQTYTDIEKKFVEEGAPKAKDPNQTSPSISAENQTEITRLLGELKTNFDLALAQNNALKADLTELLKLKKGKNKDKFMNDLNIFKSTLEKIYLAQDQVYTQMQIIGDEAELITLAKHPLKNEIVGMKKDMRIAAEIAQLIQVSDMEQLNLNLPKAKELANTLYAKKNQKLPLNSPDPNIDLLKSMVNDFYRAMPNIPDDIKMLEQRIANKEQKLVEASQRNIGQHYSNMSSKYNTFIEANNR
jgi:hypothetical protein